MNKKFEIITAGLVVIVVIGAIIFANVKGTLNKGKDIFDEKDITSSKWNILKEFIPNGDLVKFNIDAPNASLEIIKTDEKEIKIQCTNNDNSQYKINQKGNDIIIEKKEKLELFKWNIKGDNIKIEIPSTLIASIDADTSNGEIEAYECYANNLKLDTSNAEITLENLKDKEFVIDILEVSTSNASENINAKYNNKK